MQARQACRLAGQRPGPAGALQTLSKDGRRALPPLCPRPLAGISRDGQVATLCSELVQEWAPHRGAAPRKQKRPGQARPP